MGTPIRKNRFNKFNKSSKDKTNSLAERYKIKSDLVFFIDLGQGFLYKMSLKDDEVSKVSENSIKEKKKV